MSSIRKFVLYAIYMFVVIGLGLVIFFAFIHNNKSKAPVAKAPSGSQQVSHNPVVGSRPEQTPKSTTPMPSSAAAGDSAKNAIANATATAPAVAATTGTAGTLTNTGPGDVWAIFAGSSLVATVAYRFRLLRRVV
jgi:cytoskeletal protein RodZ